MGLNGTFFDSKNVKRASGSPATYALRNPKGKDAQLYLTDYTINSAVESGFTTGNQLDITYLLKEYLNVTVTTDNMGIVVPQILKKYGSGKPVGLAGKFINAPSHADFTKGNMAFTGSLLVTVTIDKEIAIEAPIESFAGSFALHSSSGKIFGAISKASAGTIGNPFKTTLGITAGDLLKMMQDAIDGGVVTANADLKTGVEIPSIMGIDISDVEINFYPGYGEVGMSLGSMSWLQIAQKMSDWKQHLLKMKMESHSWSLKKAVSKKMDKIGAFVEKKSDKLDKIIDKAADKFGSFIGKKKEHIKEKMPEVVVDNEGGQWDLNEFIDHKVMRFQKDLNKQSKNLEKLIDDEIESFVDDLPENKEDILD